MICFGYWLIFNFTNIRNVIVRFSNDYATELSIIGLIIIFLIFIFFYIKKRNNYVIFLSIFFFFQYSLLFYNSYKNYFYDSASKTKLSFKKEIYLNSDSFSKYKNIKTPNIYYVILDEMTSISHFEKMFPGVGEKEMIKEISKSYYYIDDLSTFSLTALTLASVLNLDRIVQFGDNISNYNHNVVLFPKNLSETNFKLGNEPRLNKILNKAGYEFYWIGNNWGNCKSYNINLCYSKNINTNKNKFYNLPLLLSFYKHTPLEIFLRKFFQIKNKKETYIGDDFFENDAINKFLKLSKNLNKKDKYFFLIHHFSPHKPYIYNSDCTLDSKLKTNFSEDLIGYKNNYLCALKKINIFLDYIEQSDPDSIVIIQGDHGFKNDENFTKNDQIDKFKIFNLLKLTKNCKINNKKNSVIGNVNSIRIALNCAFNINLEMIDAQPAYSNKKKNKKFGLVNKLKIN